MFDLISDTHWDKWISPSEFEPMFNKKLGNLFNLIIPEKPSDILVIPGDIGHNNEQNYLIFKKLKEIYKYVIWTHGNHDLYIVNALYKQTFGIYRDIDSYLYNEDSFNRLNEMVNLANSIDGVHYLNGNIVDINGIKFGGCAGWYDGRYATEMLNFKQKIVNKYYKSWSDSYAIMKDGKSLNYKSYFKEQYDLLRKSCKDVDVMVTHMGPDWSFIDPKFKNELSSSFFYFDGRKLLNQMNGKLWCYGHTHTPVSGISKGGCRLLCNPLGYPQTQGFMGFNLDWVDYPDTVRKILTVK